MEEKQEFKIGQKVMCVKNNGLDHAGGVPHEKRWGLGDTFIVKEIEVVPWGTFLHDGEGHDLSASKAMIVRQFKCIKGEKGLDDFPNLSGTFQVDQTIKDKIYEEHFKADIHNGDYHSMKSRMIPSGHVIDDNSCWREIGSESFKEYFEEIFVP